MADNCSPRSLQQVVNDGGRGTEYVGDDMPGNVNSRKEGGGITVRRVHLIRALVGVRCPYLGRTD